MHTHDEGNKVCDSSHRLCAKALRGGRILAQNVKEMDEFEYSYLPENFITVFASTYTASGEPNGVETIYTHKFDSLDTNELSRRCWEQGIFMFCWFGRGGEYENYPY